MGDRRTGKCPCTANHRHQRGGGGAAIEFSKDVSDTQLNNVWEMESSLSGGSE